MYRATTTTCAYTAFMTFGRRWTGGIGWYMRPWDGLSVLSMHNDEWASVARWCEHNMTEAWDRGELAVDKRRRQKWEEESVTVEQRWQQ